ncbi:MAG: hypothetical protein EOP47_16595 [Sphingobacteriaceae bacterium]|nr:MAG: hypothetical protein EOP47_16595 [Sphingobacteriaceae bacterium]
MKRRSLSCVLCALMLVFQACKKNEEPGAKPENASAQNPVTDINKSSGLKVDITPGAYGTYQLINSENNKTGQIAGLSVTNYGTGDIADYKGNAHQKWRITYKGGAYFTFMNLGSGKMLESFNYNGKQELVQNNVSGNDSQLWRIIQISDKKYSITNKASNLTITGNPAGRILLTAYAAKPAQLWGLNVLTTAAYRDDIVNNFFRRRLPSQGSVAFDQGSSTPLSWGANNGKVLWVTQDAYDGSMLKSSTNANLKCGFFQYNNSMMIQPSISDWNPDNTPNITIPNSAQRRPRQVVDNQPGADWSWPGVCVEIGNKVYVHNGEGKGLGMLNQSLFELTQAAGTEWTTKRLTPAGMSGQTETNFSIGFVKPGDGFVYSFGTKGAGFNGSDLYVARFPVTDPLSWTYWNGTAWTTTRSVATAAKIGHGQQNLTVGYLNGKYILMQLDLGFFCDPGKHNIYLATSTSPTGPFTAFKEVFTIEDRYRGHLNRYYTPMIHPESVNGKNELLLTYSLNFGSGCAGVGDDNCVNNEQPSTNYQVKGVRVPYSLIGL